MSLIGLPTEISDGEYCIEVENVHRTWEDHDSVVETAIVAVTPLRSTATQSVTTPVDGDLFPMEPAEGEVYRGRVVGGEITELRRDWERGVRRAAAELNDELALPLESAQEHVPGTLESPSLAALPRNKSLLVTGEPGAGKTEAITLLLEQIRADEDTPMVVFSFKDDYVEWAEGRDDIVRLSTRNSTHVYNIFEEVDPRGRRNEDEFDEMANVLLEEHRRHSKSRFFPDAAGDLLGAILKYLYREGKKSGLRPDNRELLHFVRRFDQEEAYKLLTGTDDNGEADHSDLHGSAGHITPEAPKQAGGVYSTLRLIVEQTFGAGDLSAPGRAGETVSIREYMENPDGRVLLLDFPIAEAKRVRPAFRFLLQRAIKFGLKDRGQAYYVLDEFARIPDVTNMEELVDTGRAQNAQAILGLQSISQLDAKYGKHIGESLRSGMLYELHLRSGDPRTVEYVRHRLGGASRVTSYDYDGGPESPGHVSQTVTGERLTPILQQLEDGEGFLVTPRGSARVSLPMYSELSRETRRAIGATCHTKDRSRDGVAPER